MLHAALCWLNYWLRLLCLSIFLLKLCDGRIRFANPKTARGPWSKQHSGIINLLKTCLMFNFGFGYELWINRSIFEHGFRTSRSVKDTFLPIGPSANLSDATIAIHVVLERLICIPFQQREFCASFWYILIAVKLYWLHLSPQIGLLSDCIVWPFHGTSQPSRYFPPLRVVSRRSGQS